MLYAKCIDDPAWWFSTFVWTFDPREPTAKMPMVLFPLQSELVGWMKDRESNREGGLIEKSRDFGLTWLCAGYAMHGWLFRSGCRFGFGSRKLEYVDNSEDDKTIFAKLRFILDNLPWWMKPKNYLSKYCLLKNFDTQNSISGEGGDSIGRGDRTTVYFVDEAAFLERPKQVDAALAATTNCRFDVSTPNGMGNSFYSRRHDGRTKVFTCHWRADPRKNDAWYEEQKGKLDPVTLAQEVDIDYAASVEGICIPAKWVRTAVELHKRIEMPQNGAPIAALDIAAEGGDSNVLGFRIGPVLQDEILDWKGVDTTFTATKAKDECLRLQVSILNFDNGGGYGEPVAQLGRVDKGFKVRALNGGESPSDTIWPDGRTSKEKFKNARAEWWWLMRERFRKTWEMSEGKKVYPPDELISIPNNATLISQLSMPLAEVDEAGKTRIEGKIKMKKRGVKSPDFADMLAYSFAPVPPVRGWNIV